MVLKKRYFKILFWWMMPSIPFILFLIISGIGQAATIYAGIVLVIVAGCFLGAILHITILSFMNGSKLQRSVILLVSLTLCFFFYFQVNEGVLNGYHYVHNRVDFFHLKKNDEIAVEPTIVSMDKFSKYIVGLRLVSQALECDQGGSYKFRVLNKREYFILDTELEKNKTYTSEQSFLDRLNELDIKSEADLDFTAFDRVWSIYSAYYKNKDFSECVVNEYPS